VGEEGISRQAIFELDPDAMLRRLWYAIKYLGASFFTKFLYFSPGAGPGRQAPILDDRVADSLHQNHGWTSLGTGPYWPAATYERYHRLLTRWASEATAAQGRPVWPDEIERRLFGSGAPPSVRAARG
jgi:hypothetical protein